MKGPNYCVPRALTSATLPLWDCSFAPTPARELPLMLVPEVKRCGMGRESRGACSEAALGSLPRPLALPEPGHCGLAVWIS